MQICFFLLLCMCVAAECAMCGRSEARADTELRDVGHCKEDNVVCAGTDLAIP